MKKFFIALTFLTRLPVPFRQDFKQEEFNRAQPYYPLVGLVIGIFLYFVWSLAARCFPPLITAALVLTGEYLITGGIHLDGFMDSMDGLFSGRAADKTLEIMKDSRIGSYAAICLFLLLMLKFAFLASLNVATAPLLVLYPALSRWAVLLAMLFFPYARKSGLGAGFHETARYSVFILEGLALLILSFILLRWSGAIAWLSALLTAYWISRRVTRRLGGLTGDVYGAIIEISQAVVLILTFAVLYRP